MKYRDWNTKNGEVKWLRDIKTKCSYPLEIKFDTRFVKNTIGRFYIIMLKPLKPLRTKIEGTYKNVITLDQGVGTFLTGFDMEGNVFKICKYGCTPEEAIDSRQHPMPYQPENQWFI